MLLGTSPVSGMFLLGALHKSLRLPGAVCEFGVAQGATSALMANELLHHAPDRTL
jgi:predicted O-methyltransferase YrrM